MAGLGDTLREARLVRKATLAEAVRATKVRQLFLAALEAERYDLLPAHIYVQGFLRTYARYLGLDAEALIALLPKEPPRALRTRQRIVHAPAFGRVWLILLAAMLLALSTGFYVYWQAATSIPSPQPFSVGVSALTPTETATAGARAETTPTPHPTPTTPTTPTAAPSVSVSAVVGLPVARAVQTLQALGLSVVSDERWSNSSPRGAVLDQSPAPGAQVLPGSTVTLVVSKGPQGLPVPNVVGKPEAEARSAVAAAGLVAARYANYQGRTDLPEAVLKQVCVGCVLSSTPAAGAAVPPGTQVFLAVRKE